MNFKPLVRPSNVPDSRRASSSPRSAAARGAAEPWYRRPARQWVEALPIGNGRLAAMVFGGINSERLQLNEDTLVGRRAVRSEQSRGAGRFARGPSADLRGEVQGGHRLIGEKMMAKPLGQMPYQPVGDLLLTFPAATRSRITAANSTLIRPLPA